MSAALKIPTIFTAVDRFSSPVRKMGNTATTFASKVEAGTARADRALRKFTPSLSGVSKEMLSFASTATVLTALVATGNYIKNFETGLIAVGKTTDMSGQELQQFGLEIIKTSNKLKTVQSDKLLELAAVAGQLGVTGQGNLLSFAETMAKLEKATDIVGEEGAASVARMLTITGEGVGVVDRFGSALVALGNTSAATESEILGVSSEVARSTAAYGLLSHEILGISTAMKSLDVAPQAAGTAVGKTFKQLEIATLKGGSMLSNFAKVMGMSKEEVKDTFAKSPTQAFSTFIKGLNKISNEGGSVQKTLMDLGLGGEIVTKGIIPLATNFELLETKLITAKEGFEQNNALQKEFESSQKTVASAITSVARSWNNLFTEQALASGGLETIRNVLSFVADNMTTIIDVVVTMIQVFAAWKLAIVAINVVLAIQRGVASALFLVDMIKYISATRGITFATAAWEIAQASLNAIMTDNPIGLIIVAVAALIALVVIVIRKWDEWGAAVSLFMGPLGFLISLIMSFRRNWDLVVQSFKDGGILGALKAIGIVILDAILMPMQQLLTIMSKLPGKVGEMAASAAVGIDEFRAKLGVETEGTAEKAINPQAERTEAYSNVMKQESQNVNINVNDKTGRATVESDSSAVPVNVTKSWVPS